MLGGQAHLRRYICCDSIALQFIFVNFKLKFQMFARFCLYDNKSDSNGMYQQSSLLRSIIVMTIFLINSP